MLEDTVPNDRGQGSEAGDAGADDGYVRLEGGPDTKVDTSPYRKDMFSNRQFPVGRQASLALDCSSGSKRANEMNDILTGDVCLSNVGDYNDPNDTDDNHAVCE